MVSVTKGSIMESFIIVVEYSKLYSIPKNQTATLGVQFIALPTESRLKPYLLNPFPAANRHIMNLFSCHYPTSINSTKKQRANHRSYQHKHRDTQYTDIHDIA